MVGAITPWNFPLNLNLAKLGPALAAGNTVVLKPAPDTPWSATVLGRIIAEETDIPAGVVNVVASSDHLVGEVLTTDPRVDMITFTGSTATGRRIMAKGSDTVKKVFLELGGKSANIVLDDAPDPGGAIAVSAIGVCTHAGQGCAITTRLLLPRSRYDEFLELADAMMAGVTYGDPWDAANLQGPLISAKQRDRVHGLHREGQGRGSPAGAGRIAARPVRQGLLRGAHPVRRRRPRGHHRPGGDLRAGAGGHRLRRRRRRRAHRQRLHLRAVGRRDERVGGAGHGRGPAGARPAPSW